MLGLILLTRVEDYMREFEQYPTKNVVVPYSCIISDLVVHVCYYILLPLLKSNCLSTRLVSFILSVEFKSPDDFVDNYQSSVTLWNYFLLV